MKKMRTTFTCLIHFLSLSGIALLLVSCQQPANKQKPSGSAVTHEAVPEKKSDHPVVSDSNTRNVTNTQNTRMINVLDQKPDGTPGPFSPVNMNPDQKKAREFVISGSKKAKDGDQIGAIEDFTQSLNLFKNPMTYLKRGSSELLKQDYRSALNDMNEALKMNPNLNKAYLGRGICRYELKDFKTAEEDFKAYTDKDKNTPMAYNYIAGCRFMQNDFKGALENYEMVAKLDSSYPDVYTNRGMMKHYLKDLKGAVEDYNKALSVNPENVTAYNNRGGARLIQGDPRGALEDFNKAIALKDDYADAYVNRGKAKFKLDDKTGACEDWRKAYSLGVEDAGELIYENCK